MIVQRSDPAAIRDDFVAFGMQTADGTRPVTHNEISVDSVESVWNERWAGMQRPRTCITRLASCLNQSRLRCCPCRSQGGAIKWEQSVREKGRCIDVREE